MKRIFSKEDPVNLRPVCLFAGAPQKPKARNSFIFFWRIHAGLVGQIRLQFKKEKHLIIWDGCVKNIKIISFSILCILLTVCNVSLFKVVVS